MRIIRIRLACCVFAIIAILFTNPVFSDLVGHGGMIRAVDLSPDGRRVLTGSFDFSAILWDFEDQQQIARLDAHEGPVTSVSFIGDGSRALTTSDDMTVIVWDMKTLKPLHRLKGHKHKVMTAAASFDGTRAASGGWDAKVMIWDLQTGKLLKSLKIQAPVNSVVFLGRSKKIAVGGHDRTIRIFDTDNGRFLGKMEGHLMGITGLSSSADGTRLLSASIDGSLRIWDPTTFKEIRKLEGHDKQVYSAQFLKGDEMAISSGRDGTIVQWDVKTGKIIKTIKAHDSTIWAVAASRDGRFAVSAGADESARIWHLESGDRIGAEVTVSNEPQPWLESEHPGASLYKKCARCHAYRANLTRRSGPHLENLFGRRAGSVQGYRYSGAFTNVDFVWNEKTIFELFDKGPDKYLPGTKMPMQKVTNATDLRYLLDYLRGLTSTSAQAN